MAFFNVTGGDAMSGVIYKSGDRVLVWARRLDMNNPKGKLELVDSDRVNGLNQDEITAHFERVEVEFIGHVHGDEVLVRPPDNYHAWIMDKDALVWLDAHRKNIGVDFTKYNGSRALYMNLDSILCHARTSHKLSEPDGMNCSQCHEFTPMACANVGDTFKCYQCRQDRYRMSY